MLRRIKRFLGFSSRGTYFPNDETAPADGSLMSNASRKSTKSEKKSAKKEKKKSPLADEDTMPSFIHVSSPEIVIGGEESMVCSMTEADRQTIITDSLPYRDPSDKVFLESPPLMVQQPASSTRSLAGSSSVKSRLDTVASDALPIDASSVESIYSTDLTHEICDEKSRELPVDCDLPKSGLLSPPQSSPSSTGSSLCVNLPAITAHHEQEEAANGPEEVAAMKKFNAELDGLLKTSAPPFQVSCARLPPMLTKELPPPEESLLSNDEFDDSKNNSVARILNESHEATTRSPENKHLRSYGY